MLAPSVLNHLYLVRATDSAFPVVPRRPHIFLMARLLLVLELLCSLYDSGTGRHIAAQLLHGQGSESEKTGHHGTGPLGDSIHHKGSEHEKEFDHEAFLGKDTAHEFDELTPEISKERLAKLVPKMDSNGDGFIEESELKDHITFMQKRYVNNDVDRQWKNYKEHQIKDGKLAWQDYRAVVYGIKNDEEMEKHRKEGGADGEHDYSKMIARDERRWKVADYDGDGLLDRTEYGCFMHPEDCEHMRDAVVQETVEDIDKDKDGFVDIEEYIADMYRPSDYPELQGREPDWVASEREMFREHRDKDNDGRLNKEEMTDWIMPLNFDHADAEAKHLVGLADDNKDGKLSPDEVIAHYDTFVGSQATDYGEQLQKHDPADL